MLTRMFFPTMANQGAARGLAPVLLDNFNGSGALTSHTPDICPVGSSWSVAAGTWGNLSGGYLPYSSGNNGKAVINCGLSNLELRWRTKCKSVANGFEYGGILIRSNSNGSDAYGFDLNYSSTYGSTIYGSAGTGIIVNLSEQPVNATQRNYAMTPDQYYEFRLLVFSDVYRLYDSLGTLLLAGTNLVKTSNTYVGLLEVQGAIAASWDFLSVYPISQNIVEFSVMGDSISNDATEWPGIVAARHNNGYCRVDNHAVSGSSILAQMDGQTDQCETDANNFTIIALGTNDGSSDRTAEYQENLIELWGTLGKPIYAMGVLPKDPDTNRATQNGFIQTAVANAQAAGVNVTYWNTDGWFDPTSGVDTADGLHPNNSGQAKITTEVLARL